MTFTNDNISQVFSRYIENFVKINDDEHEEYYKWQVCHEFKNLMDKALETEDYKFSKALMKVKECTRNIIDSYTQPFYGLVKFAEKEPSTVKQMFRNLYVYDAGNLDVQMKKIADFFEKSNTLLEKYFPGSYLYRQNSHSVSAYLFLYDPDHHYMYKATECKKMADCIGFYDSWGSGDNIKLDVFYRMCDQLVKRIRECQELLKTDASRFDVRFRKLRNIELHPDTEKHILLFDIIYCCNTYDLFNIIPFVKPNTKERQLITENRKKAKELLIQYNEAKKNVDKLQEAIDYFSSIVGTGDIVHHKKYGDCVIEEINNQYIVIKVLNEDNVKKLRLCVVLANEIVSYDTEDFKEKLNEYREYLKKAEGISKRLEYAIKALKPYEDYILL